MRRRPFLTLLAGLSLAACTDVRPPTSPDVAPRAGAVAAPITVMTRNLYLGADIDLLVAPGADLTTGLQAALAQVNHTDYPARAQYLALEIVARMPQVIGLQEVTRYDFVTPAGTQTLDFLDILQAFLVGMGAHYDVAVRQTNISLTLPVGFGGITAVSYADADAILVRHDVAWSDPTADHYATQVTLSVAGTPFENLRGWNAVTVEASGFDFRFVNTHLEVQRFEEVQEQQARELVALLEDEPLPIVLVGDFNSAANPDAPQSSRTDSYRILRQAGFADLELREPQPNRLLTCCHAADLSNATVDFDQRLDLVLARFRNAGFGGRSDVEVVEGVRFLDPHGYYLWPSDHAAVFASLLPAPGLAAR